MSLSGIRRIPSGQQFIAHWLPTLDAQPIGRAHRLLLEVTRRLLQDRPTDLLESLDHLDTIQDTLNNRTSDPQSVSDMSEAFAVTLRHIRGSGSKTRPESDVRR